MIEYVSDLRLFCEIAKTLNFKLAGEQLGYSPAVVSMRVKRLETVTGKTLLLRSTRHVTVTEEGMELLQLAEKTLELTERMALSRHRGDAEVDLRGSVRISAPHSFARVFLLTPVHALFERYPNLLIELMLEDHLTEIVQESIDISFRVGGPEQSGVESKDLLADHRILVASPDYLSRHGTPNTPEELHQHQCLSYPGMRQWPLFKNGQTDLVRLQHSLYCSTGDYVSQLACNGAGIAAKSDWSVAPELKAGTLIRVLPDYTLGPARQVRMLMPKREVTPLRVITTINYLEAHIAQMHLKMTDE